MSYPDVSCIRHSPAPGYVVCRHVERGEPIAYFEAATDDDMGQVLCAVCHACPAPPDETSAIIVCAECAKVKGWLFPPGLTAM